MTVADQIEALADAIQSGAYVVEHDVFFAMARLNAVVAQKSRGARDYSPELATQLLQAKARKAAPTLHTDRK